jgi:hypothetical protein
VGAFSGARKLVSGRNKAKSPDTDSNPFTADRGHRFEFADGVVAYAKLRGSWDLTDILVLLSQFKDANDFTRKIAPLIYARAAYRLEKFSYAEAKERRREVELALIEELTPEFASHGTKLKGITIGSFAKEIADSEKNLSGEIPLGTQSKKFHIPISRTTDSGVSAVDIMLNFRITNPYKFLYASVGGPYAYVQPIVESEVRFEFASKPLQAVSPERQAIEQCLLAKLAGGFAFVGLTLDNIKILNIQ